MTDEDRAAFIAHIKACSAEVKKWPLWKQNVLGGVAVMRILHDRPGSWRNGVRYRQIAGGKPGRLVNLTAWDFLPFDNPGPALVTTGADEGCPYMDDPESFPLSHLDTAPHTAFVRGSLPPAIYADWLEENSIPVPVQVLELLRS